MTTVPLLHAHTPAPAGEGPTRADRRWFDFLRVDDISMPTSAAVHLWGVVGRPEECRSASTRCAKYPLLLERSAKECATIPSFRNIAVTTDKGRTR